MILKIIFWFIILSIVYSYLLYTLLLWLVRFFIKAFSKDELEKSDEYFEPEVTLFIAAYNEKYVVHEKMENTYSLDYPKEKFKVLWVTDGSDDGTEYELKKYENITVLHEKERRGKIGAINRGMDHIETPIVIFSDCNSMLNKECIREIVREFASPAVGCVAGEKRITKTIKDAAVSSGEGFYWKYESLIKKWESDVNSTVGAAGELFAIRTGLFEKAEPDTLLDDFVISLRIAQKGYRIKYTPGAYAVEEASINVKEEMKRKIRIACGGIQSMARFGSLLNPLKYGFLAIQYISHKVLRWTVVPFGIFIAFIVNGLILKYFDQSALYSSLFYLQLAFFILVIVGWTIKNMKVKLRFFFVPYYIVMMNVSIIRGYFRYFRGKQSVNWEKASRG